MVRICICSAWLVFNTYFILIIIIISIPSIKYKCLYILPTDTQYDILYQDSHQWLGRLHARLASWASTPQFRLCSRGGGVIWCSGYMYMLKFHGVWEGRGVQGYPHQHHYHLYSPSSITSSSYPHLRCGNSHGRADIRDTLEGLFKVRAIRNCSVTEGVAGAGEVY